METTAPIVRWGKRQKVQIVRDIRFGTITREEAMARHAISEEELAEWEKNYKAGGVDRLRVTHVSRYRRRDRDAEKA